MSNDTITRKVEVTVTEQRTETRTVEFPVYFNHRGSYGKIRADGSGIIVTPEHPVHGASIEFVEDYNFAERSGPEYHLGKATHRCSATKWEEKARKVLSVADILREELNND